LFIVLDEIDVIKFFTPSSATTSVYHDLLELLFTELKDSPHLVLCVGASTDLLYVGRGLSKPSNTPTGLKVSHVQFSALGEQHIAQVLERRLPSLPQEDRLPLARCVLKETSGVARLVHYAVDFLKPRLASLELAGFVDYLLAGERRKDVDRCYVRQQEHTFFALAEFALWRFPLAKEDTFDFQQLVAAGNIGIPLRPMRALDVAGFYGLHTSKYSDDQPQVCVTLLIIVRLLTCTITVLLHSIPSGSSGRHRQGVQTFPVSEPSFLQLSSPEEDAALVLGTENPSA
jgi:hypothetical protein